ncbi:MAG: hypothetical protein IJW25_00940, partial [Clostridia bacterium]|nr:hypothetical protein [Clostridia bacterium]
MKKFKYLPTIIIMVLCIAIIGVGIYAINLTQNKVVGSLTIGASNPAVNLTVYYVPDGTTAENAVLNDANKIGTTKTARYGVELDLTDDRLNFKMSNINSLSEVKPKNIAIKIENTSDKVLGAYFADLENAAEVKTTLALSSYNSRVAFTEGTLVPGHAKADFSGYKKIPAKANDVNGEAIVKMSVSILKLSGIRLYIDIDALLVIEEYDPAKGGVDFETDPHIAMNITEEAYQFNTSALSTTGTTIDAEVYNFSGMNVGLVNLKYEDSQVAALSSTSKRTPSALSVSPLTNVTTFSFNYSVTTADGTKVSAEEIFSDENTTDGIVFIGIGNYAGVSNIFPDMMSGTLVQFTKGNEFTVLGDVITITYDLSEELLFFIGHETAEGMKITISTVDSSTKLSLVTAIDKRVESLIPLEVGALISIPTDSNVILDDQSLGVMPVRAYRTTTANPSFAFAIMIGEEIAGVETLVSAGFMAMMIKGCYTDPLECLINLETGAIPQSDMLNKGTDYDFSGAEVIINQELLTQEYQDFTL